MPTALMCNHGRYHSVIECSQKTQPKNTQVTRFTKWLQDGHSFVSIMWAGGWDEYIIDDNQVKELSIEEQASIEIERKKFGCIRPVRDGWLLGTFIKGKIAATQKVKIIEHLAGGD